MAAHLLWVAAALLAGLGQASPHDPRLPPEFGLYSEGPHVGQAPDAIVGVVVTNLCKAGPPQAHYGSGVVLRCDGFVLVPTPLFSRAYHVSDRVVQAADSQRVDIIVHPGTPDERRVPAGGRYFAPETLPFGVVKMAGAHTPAAMTLLPDSLQPGDALEVFWTAYDEATGRFGKPQSRPAAFWRVGRRLGGPGTEETALGLDIEQARSEGTPEARPQGKDAKQSQKGLIVPAPAMLFEKPVPGVPDGGVVVGPHGLAVGMLSSTGGLSCSECFRPFSDLNRVSNCVTPASVPPAMYGMTPAVRAGAAEATAVPMVKVDGGPVLLLKEVLNEQQDMNGCRVACVAPFEIDKYEVTNRQYLAFWNALPEARKKSLAFRQAYLPSGWALLGDPFPPELADAPVLGVSAAGAGGYARWVGKRLPTPYEWWKAALGPLARWPDWMPEYLYEHCYTWGYVCEEHKAYLQSSGLGHSLDKVPGWDVVPWVPFSLDPDVGLAWMAAAQWSHNVTVEAAESLMSKWSDPDLVLPVGSRDYDQSPYGARDMMLNAWEAFMPLPDKALIGWARYCRIRWKMGFVTPAQVTEWKGELPKGGSWSVMRVVGGGFTPMRAYPDLGCDGGYIGQFQPLSRLFRRIVTAPPLPAIFAVHSIDAVRRGIEPLKEWQVYIQSDPFSKSTVLEYPLPLPPPAEPGRTWKGSTAAVPPGFQYWQHTPPRYRQELGIRPPLDQVERHYTLDPPLQYILPVGFRCVR